jgi:tetratricopeptide (TPR) repeat protein
LLTGLSAGRYRIHPALPGYLADWWRRDDPGNHDAVREAATRTLLAAYAALGVLLDKQISSGNAGFVYALITLERRTMGGLLGYALDHGLWHEAIWIASPLDQYWKARGLDEEATAWADRARLATEGPDGTPPPLDTHEGALWLFFVGTQARRELEGHHLDDAERTYQQLLAMLRAQPASPQQQRHLATCYQQLGEVAHDRGRLDDAEGWYRKALAVAEELGDKSGIAPSYHMFGRVAQRRGRLDDAEQWYRKALAIREELGNAPDMVAIFHQLGMVAQHGGRLDDAEEWYHKALAVVEELGDEPGKAAIYHQLGNIAQDRGLLDDAEEWYRKALAIKEELGDESGLVSTYHQLGIIAFLWGRLDDAEEWCRKALAIAEEVGNEPDKAAIYHQLGRVAQDRGQLEDAEQWYRKSLAIKEELGDEPGMATTFGQLGRLAEEQGQPRQALEWMVRSVALFGEFPHPATGPAPDYLARLTVQLGTGALEQCWQQVTGHPLPPAVRSYLASSQAHGRQWKGNAS